LGDARLSGLQINDWGDKDNARMEMLHSCYDWPLIGRNARQDYRLVGEAHVNRALDGEIITNLQKDASGADVSLFLNRWRRARQAL
jgi:hypothetical protein